MCDSQLTLPYSLEFNYFQYILQIESFVNVIFSIIHNALLEWSIWHKRTLLLKCWCWSTKHQRAVRASNGAVDTAAWWSLAVVRALQAWGQWACTRAEAAGGTGMWAGARQTPAAGAFCRSRKVSTTQAIWVQAPAQATDVRQTLGAGLSTCPGFRCRAALLYRWTLLAQHTVPTDCRVTVMHHEIKLLCPGSIPTKF